MNERENEYKHLGRERMISLADLFEEILRKIWLIIVLAVVFAVLCAGYKYMSDRSNAEAALNVASQTDDNTALTDEEVSEVNNVLRLYEQSAAEEQYLSESIRMQIDPYNEDRVVMQFVVQANAEDVDAIVDMMDSYITDGAIATDLQTFYPDTEGRYLKELVSFYQGSTEGDASDEEAEVTVSKAFTVVVINTDQEAAEQLSDAAKQCIDSYAGELSEGFGSFEMNFLGSTVTQIYDSNLRSVQTSAVSDQYTLQNRITTQEGNLSDSQLEVLEAYLNGNVISERNSEDADEIQEVSVTVHISVRYLILGVLIGIVVGIILITLYYIARGTLNVVQEMSAEFGLPVFGQIHEKRQRNPLVKAWRRMVYKKKVFSVETERKIVIMNLKTFCRNHQVDKILLTGSREDLTEDTELKEICSELMESGIASEIVGGFPDSPDALEKADENGCIILVETLHCSYYADVAREVETCTGQNLKMAGSIVLD